MNKKDNNNKRIKIRPLERPRLLMWLMVLVAIDIALKPIDEKNNSIHNPPKKRNPHPLGCGADAARPLQREDALIVYQQSLLSINISIDTPHALCHGKAVTVNPVARCRSLENTRCGSAFTICWRFVVPARFIGRGARGVSSDTPVPCGRLRTHERPALFVSKQKVAAIFHSTTQGDPS